MRSCFATQAEQGTACARAAPSMGTRQHAPSLPALRGGGAGGDGHAAGWPLVALGLHVRGALLRLSFPHLACAPRHLYMCTYVRVCVYVCVRV